MNREVDKMRPNEILECLFKGKTREEVINTFKSSKVFFLADNDTLIYRNFDIIFKNNKCVLVKSY